MVKLVLLRPLNLLLVFINSVAKVSHNSSVVLMLPEMVLSRSTKVRVRQLTLDSVHIGDHVLTSKVKLLVLLRLQELEISLVQADSLILVINLNVQHGIIILDLLRYLKLQKIMVQLLIRHKIILTTVK